MSYGPVSPSEESKGIPQRDIRRMWGVEFEDEFGSGPWTEEEKRIMDEI